MSKLATRVVNLGTGITQNPLQSSSCIDLYGMAGVEPTDVFQSLFFSKFTLTELFGKDKLYCPCLLGHWGYQICAGFAKLPSSSHKTVRELLFSQEQTQRGTWAQGYSSQHKI